MKPLRYTLLSDGSSDRALLPILTWVLRSQGIQLPIQPDWADLRRLPNPPTDLSNRIAQAVRLFPCDLLFVHRDAENTALLARVEEIRSAVSQAVQSGNIPPAICVVPVRMMEAWLLFNETAIRKAAGNPNGRESIALPPLQQLEQLTNPKQDLAEILRAASGLRGRRRRRLHIGNAIHRIAELTPSFEPLRTLDAFRFLEDQVTDIVQQAGWI